MKFSEKIGQIIFGLTPLSGKFFPFASFVISRSPLISVNHFFPFASFVISIVVTRKFGGKYYIILLITVADPGFPWVGRQSSRGRQHTILPKFPKNCMKLKEFGHGGACSSYPLLRSANELLQLLCIKRTDIYVVPAQKFPAIFEFSFVFSTEVIRHTKCFLGYYGGKHFIGDED